MIRTLIRTAKPSTDQKVERHIFRCTMEVAANHTLLELKMKKDNLPTIRNRRSGKNQCAFDTQAELDAAMTEIILEAISDGLQPHFIINVVIINLSEFAFSVSNSNGPLTLWQFLRAFNRRLDGRVPFEIASGEKSDTDVSAKIDMVWSTTDQKGNRGCFAMTKAAIEELGAFLDVGLAEEESSTISTEMN